MSLEFHLKRLTIAGALGLPAGLKQKLAGKPVVLDGQRLDVDVQLLLRLQTIARETAAETLPIPEGRERLTIQSGLCGGNQPIGATSDIVVGDVPARGYVPRALLDNRARPSLVFFHGGAYSTHDAACRFLAEKSGVQVIAVDYRMAPESPFPAAYDDSVAAYRAVVAQATSLSIDPERIAVGGDSAGGNLAAAVALAVVDDEVSPVWQLLVYPVTDQVNTSESRRRFSRGFFLTTEFMDLATASYLPAPIDRSDPRISPFLADIPKGLAPAHVVTAGFDPLRDEGEAYAERLRAAGVEVTRRREPGQIHGFFNMVGVGTSGPAAVGDVARRLGIALS